MAIHVVNIWDFVDSSRVEFSDMFHIFMKVSQQTMLYDNNKLLQFLRLTQKSCYYKKCPLLLTLNIPSCTQSKAYLNSPPQKRTLTLSPT